MSSKFSKSDILTPANAITLLGLLLTVLGAVWLNTFAGLLLVFIGRLLDLVDGPVARATRSTSFGAYLDPIADKFSLLAILIAVVGHHLAPLLIIGYIFVQNLLVSIVVRIAQTRGTANGTAWSGKLNMFFQQSALLFFVLARVLHNGFSPLIEVIAYADFVLSLPFGVMALATYMQQARQHKATTA